MKHIFLFAALMSQVSLGADVCPSDTNFPGESWPVKLVGADKAAAVKALEDHAFTLIGQDKERKGFRTDGLVIIKDGTLIYEKYARGFDETKKHLSWSVAKSITSMLAGVAQHQKLVGLDDSICKWLPDYSGQGVCTITLKHALTFGTGLTWQEEYEDKGYQVSSVIAMLFGVGHQNQLKHILTHKQGFPAGTHWSYSTGDAELASAVVKRAMAQQHGKDAFWTQLFNPIGMPKTIFEEDGQGTPLGGSMVYATPRDYARLGYLMIKDGCWKGTRILANGYVTAATTPSTLFMENADATEDTPSGYAWWLNRPRPSKQLPIPWADIPDDTYAALGHWGQRIIVIPSKNMVIVRTGDDRDGSMPVNELTKLALGVAR
jgi:CubicO group peptidase (beta-lactamase class C family)